MNIQNYEEFWRKVFKEHKKTKKHVEYVLNDVLEKIKFVEEIYITGGQYSSFSQDFKDSAYKERQELCQESSALYTILRDDYKETK